MIVTQDVDPSANFKVLLHFNVALNVRGYTRGVGKSGQFLSEEKQTVVTSRCLVKRWYVARQVSSLVQKMLNRLSISCQNGDATERVDNGRGKRSCPIRMGTKRETLEHLREDRGRVWRKCDVRPANAEMVR